MTGLPPTPSPSDASVTLNFSGPAPLTHYRWNLDDTFFKAEAPITTPLALSALNTGDHELEFIGKYGGVWQPTNAATVIRWRYDPAYGADLSTLTLVKTQNYPDTAGLTLTNVWDGKNGAGVPQLPGVYTVRLKLTDALGREFYRSELVFIEKLSSGETELAAGGGSSPHARGDWAVWQEQVDGVAAIRARNLTSGPLPVQVTNSVLAQEKPRTDGRYVIWQARQPNGVFDIVYADLTAAVITPVKVTSSSGRHEISAAIDWPWAVYQFKLASSETAPWQIEAKNLENNTVIRVDATTQNQFTPAIHAGRVVWQDWRDVGPGEVYFGDLESGERRRITMQPAGQYNPVIFGHTIVWQDNRNTQLDLYRFDLRKGVEERLTNTPFNEVNPVIFGTWLTYLEDSLGASTENLRLMDLDSRESVPVTQSDGAHSSGALGNGYAVWGEGPAGAQRVVASFLPGLQPVMRNHNTVVLTSDLVSRYNSAFDLLSAWHSAANVVSVTRYQTIAVPPVTQTATWTGGAPAGTDFPLTAGDFLWIKFDQARLLELGTATTAPVNLASGKNVLSYSAFPVGYTAYDFLNEVGDANVGAIRMLDPLAGVWRTVELKDGVRAGANFAIPRVTALLVDMKNAVSNWQP